MSPEVALGIFNRFHRREWRFINVMFRREIPRSPTRAQGTRLWTTFLAVEQVLVSLRSTFPTSLRKRSNLVSQGAYFFLQRHQLC